MARAPAICGSLRSIRSSAMPLWRHRSTPDLSSGCWPFHANGTPELWSISSLDPRSKPFFRWRTATPGLGDGIHAFLLTAVQTGLRLSELTGLRQQDVSLGAGAYVSCEGKGRKERCTPLAKPTETVLDAWIKYQGKNASRFLFPSTRGGRL